MAKKVTFVIMGVEMQAVIGEADTDQDARAAILAEIAKSFRVVSIDHVKKAPKKRASIWETYADGFMRFAESLKATAPQ